LLLAVSEKQKQTQHRRISGAVSSLFVGRCSYLLFAFSHAYGVKVTGSSLTLRVPQEEGKKRKDAGFRAATTVPAERGA